MRIDSFAVLICAAAACAAAGCTGGKPEVVKSRGARGAGGATTATAGQCEQWRAAAADMLRPGVLGRTAEADRAAKLLNLFLAEEACTGVPPGPLPLDPAAAAVLTGLLGGGGPEFAAARRLEAADARFLRTRLLDAAAVGGLAPAGTDPETAATLLNEYVAGVLFPLGFAARPAGTTYHARLRGEGDWADRAWLLADLLRQAGIDAVLLSPETWGDGSPDQPTAWVGALLPADDGAVRVALFDARTGLPVPSSDDPDRPARLGEVADGAGRAALETFYRSAGIDPPTADAVAAVRPRLIAEPAWFREANQLLNLPAADIFETGGAGAGDSARPPVVAVSPHDTAAGPGLVSRVAGAFGVGPGEVTLWPVPGERAAAADDAGFPETLAAPLRLGLKPARGGVEFVETDGGGVAVEYDPEGAEPALGPSDLMWRHRHEQLAATPAGLRAAAAGLPGLAARAGRAARARVPGGRAPAADLRARPPRLPRAARRRRTHGGPGRRRRGLRGGGGGGDGLPGRPRERHRPLARRPSPAGRLRRGERGGGPGRGALRRPIPRRPRPDPRRRRPAGRPAQRPPEPPQTGGGLPAGRPRRRLRRRAGRRRRRPPVHRRPRRPPPEGPARPPDPLTTRPAPALSP